MVDEGSFEIPTYRLTVWSSAIELLTKNFAGVFYLARQLALPSMLFTQQQPASLCLLDTGTWWVWTESNRQCLPDGT